MKEAVEEIRYLGSNTPEFLTLMLELSGCTQKELAETIGIKGATVSRILNGIDEPGMAVSNKISTAFGLSLPERISIGLVPDGVTREGGSMITGEGEQLEVFLGAYAIRAQNGPPLTESETDLVKFLIDRSLQIDPSLEPQT